MTLVFLQISAGAATITINSGTSPFYFFAGSNTGDFSPAVLDATLALPPSNGTPAAIINPVNPAGWISNASFDLQTGSSASWIGVARNAGTTTAKTALYGVTFVIPGGPITSASFTLNYVVDDTLGSTNAGIYINGQPLPNSTGIGVWNSQTPITYSNSNIASLLKVGTNTLYFDNVNVVGPAGVILNATINYTTPDAATFATLGMGLCGIWFAAYYRKKLKKR